MAAPPTSGDFGRKLRESRERRGVSLRHIADTTKISVRALESLERNDIAQLPGGIFSRAFVRAYAAQVGLNPEATVQEFIAQFPHDSVTAGHPTSRRIEDPEDFEEDRQSRVALLQLAAVSIPIAIVIVYFGASALRGRSAIVVDTPPVAAATPAVAAASDRPDADSAGIADTLTVVFAASRPSWVSVTADGSKLIERTLDAGERYSVAVHQELVLSAGDAGAIALTLNGAEAKPLGKSGEAATARLNLANFHDYLLAQ